ncbi:MAG: hypothetical protein ACNI27_08980 [Desulfovibrio sp.]
MVFENSDERLKASVAQVVKDRSEAGLDGLVGGLECVVINTEPEDLKAAVQEFISVTGYDFEQAFEDDLFITCVLKLEGGADFLLRSRKGGSNPFLPYNAGPKSSDKPAARLETFIYKAPRLEEYLDIQHKRGKTFMTPQCQSTSCFKFVQTNPSDYTGNSLGFIEWTAGQEGCYCHDECTPLDWKFEKPDWPHLKNLFEIDHTATRVHAEKRDNAILEFMEYTNYKFDFAVYVESLNSITNVARLSYADYAQVFTSGIKPFETLETSGPTEKYIHNYGLRVHHMAFRAENIEETFQGLKDHGMQFLVELVGGEEEGLHQTFSKQSPLTFLVNEYIQRYGGFDGFFTKSNVTELTRATDQQ